MKRSSIGLLLAFCIAAFAVAGCGGSGDAQLSRSAYKSKLAAISKQVDSAHEDLSQGAAKATTIAEVQAVLNRYATAEQRIGDEVSKLKPPADAEAANAKLARGERDDAAEIRALLPGLAKFKSVREAFAYLQSVGHTKGGDEQDAALKQLEKLGYKGAG